MDFYLKNLIFALLLVISSVQAEYLNQTGRNVITECPGMTPEPCTLENDPVCPPGDNTLANSICLLTNPSDPSLGGFCMCPLTHVEHCDGGECVPLISTIGGVCKITAQCNIGKDENGTSLGVCSPQGKCGCNPYSVISDDGEKCLPKRELIDQPCESQNQCLGVGGTDPTLAKCSEGGKCECNPNNGVPNKDKKCVKIMDKVGDSCEVNAQCQRRVGDDVTAICLGGSCRCVESISFESEDGKCFRLLDIECKDEEQCQHLGNANCTIDETEPVCSCSDYEPGFPGLPSNDRRKCLTYVDTTGQECERAEQCKKLDPLDVGGLTDCWKAWSGDPKMYCECLPEAAVVAPDRSKCLKLLDNGYDTCEINEQCKNILESECKTEEEDDLKKCRCKDGFVGPSYPTLPTPSQRCLPIVTRENATCTYQLQCTAGLGDHSTCSPYFRCVCSPDTEFLPYDHTCHKPVPLNETCEFDGECMVANNTTHAACIDDKCSCKKEAILSGGKCFERKKIGDKCEAHDECQVPLGPTAECDRVSKDCQCQSGSTPEFENTRCVAGFGLRLQPLASNWLGLGLLLMFSYAKL